MRKCDSCGKIYQENKDVFCPHCGAVAQKQCTHGSLFDSNRYDRGEIYKDYNTQDENTTYNKGYEPHAQREGYTYSRSESEKSNRESAPKFELPDFTKMLSKGKSNNGKSIGVIIVICIIAFNFVLAMFSFNTSDDVDYWEDEVVLYEDEKYYAEVSSATVNVLDDEDGTKTFEIAIADLHFQGDMLSESSAIQTQINDGSLFSEIRVCVFSQTEIPEEDYNNAINEGYFISAENNGEDGRFVFTYDFGCNEVVHIVGGIPMYLDNGMVVNAELPFGAFSVSEDGEITYYTSYADDETEWNTVFTECVNNQEIENYDVCIMFD